MKNLKKLFAVLFVLQVLFTGVVYANDPMDSGDKGGNGGDPMASQFVVMAQQLARYYEDNPFRLELPFSAESFSKEVEILSRSLEGFGRRHLVEFTDEKIIDVNGVEKPGAFEIGKPASDTQIRINRDAWLRFSDLQKLTQINLEILGILKVENRYEIAEILVKNHELKISSIPLVGKRIEKRPGWKIVGEDPDQFAEISLKDVLIDGGPLGLGSEMNKRIESFFSDPFGKTSAAWLESIFQAWKNGRPGYLLLNSPDGNNATVTAIRGVRYKDHIAFEAYSLFFTKYRQIYSGDCVDSASKLSSLNRLKDCYLDLSNYNSFDDIVETSVWDTSKDGAIEEAMVKMFAQLRARFLSFYATDYASLAAVHRSYFITDYSLAVPQYSGSIMHAAVAAFGLEPSFEGPFDRVWFWKQTDRKNVRAKRLYEAAKTLAQNDLLFLDGNTNCPSFRGPKIVSRAQWKADDGKCFFHRMGILLKEEIYEAMVAYGFYYDYANQKWLFDDQGGQK